MDLNLRSNFLTANDGSTPITKLSSKSRTLPYAFTEQGIYMLMTVLKGELATEQSKALIRTFKGMKDFIVENRYLIGNKELFQLSIQTAQNTADIAEIKSTMITKTDLAKVVRDFTDPITRREHLILNGESVEANIAYSNIYKSASGIFHDRYIILDYNTDGERIFHCGASSKDAGNKVTTITEVADIQVYHQIVDTLLNNPTLLF